MTIPVPRKRKLDRNLGGDYPREAPTVLPDAAVLLVERFLKRLLETATEQLLKRPEDAKRFFSHFFDTTTSTTERDQFCRAFAMRPPKTVIGYARSGAEMPSWAIVMASEQEEDAFVGDEVGIVGDVEFKGAFFSAEYDVFTYADHPDITAVLYQLSKAIVHAGKALLLQQGVLEVRLGGGDLRPDEEYMPENMYIRVLRVHTKHPYSAPLFLPSDPAKLRTLIFANDVVMDGVRGGVIPSKVVDGEVVPSDDDC